MTLENYWHLIILIIGASCHWKLQGDITTVTTGWPLQANNYHQMFNTRCHHIILMMTVWWDRTVGKYCFQRDLSKTENKNFFPVLSGVRAAGACLVRMYLVEIGDLAKHYRYQLSQHKKEAWGRNCHTGELLYRNTKQHMKDSPLVSGCTEIWDWNAPN